MIVTRSRKTTEENTEDRGPGQSLDLGKGVHYIIERGGKPIDSMKSIDEKIDPRTLGELQNLLKKLPKLEAFASDIQVLIRINDLTASKAEAMATPAPHFKRFQSLWASRDPAAKSVLKAG